MAAGAGAPPAAPGAPPTAQPQGIQVDVPPSQPPPSEAELEKAQRSGVALLEALQAAPERPTLPVKPHAARLPSGARGVLACRRAAAFDETSENEQLLPRLADVALPRVGGPDALEERDHVLDCASSAPKVSNYLTVRIILVWRRLFKRIPDTRVLQQSICIGECRAPS